MSAEDPRPGDRLTRLHLQYALGIKEAPRSVRVPEAGGYGFDSRAIGSRFTPIGPQEFWVKLVGGGSGGLYAWVEQIPDTGGTWVDGGRSGTVSDDPAIEVNGNAGLPTDSTARAWARRGHDHVLRFQLGLCG